MTAVAAACLAGVAPTEVVPALAELTGAHLVTADAGGRYGQHDLLGTYARELAPATEALSVLQELGDGPGQANTWDTIGWAHHRLGDHPQAAACYDRALALFRAHGDRFHEADTLVHLGDSQHAAGLADEARRTRQQAGHSRVSRPRRRREGSLQIGSVRGRRGGGPSRPGAGETHRTTAAAASTRTRSRGRRCSSSCRRTPRPGP